MRTSQEDFLHLEEGGQVAAYYRRRKFGIFGSCRPQLAELVDQLCDAKAEKIYSQDTAKHRSGEKTVQVIRSALEVLPDIQTRQTPPNSQADVVCKWDLIVEHQNRFYPLQIKSGIEDIWKGQAALDERIHKIKTEIESIRKDYENRIRSLMVERGWKTRENKAIVHLEEECKQKCNSLREKIEEHESRAPLFIWAAETDDTIAGLVNAFSTLFNSQGSREELIQQAIEAYKAYKKPQLRPVQGQTHFKRTPLKAEKPQSLIDSSSQVCLSQQMNLASSCNRSSMGKSYSVKEIRKEYPRAYATWSEDEDQRLRLRYSQSSSINALSAEFERQPSAISARLEKLGLL